MTDAMTEKAQKAVGVTFGNVRLLQTALTHSSYVNEHGGESNERLEFLGDALVNCIVAEALYSCGGDEGDMTERRKRIVSKKPLAEAVRRLGLEKLLRTGRGSSQLSEKMVSDVFEAVAAAIYLDSGPDACRRFVLGNLRETELKDFKSALQRYAQKKYGNGAVRYDGEVDGHAVSTVYVDGKPCGVGKGRNLSEAEQAAAREAIDKLGIDADFI